MGDRWLGRWVVTGAAAGALMATRISLTENGPVLSKYIKVPPPPPPGGKDGDGGNGNSGEGGGDGGGTNMSDDALKFVSEHGTEMLAGAALGAVAGLVLYLAFSAFTSSSRQQAQS